MASFSRRHYGRVAMLMSECIKRRVERHERRTDMLRIGEEVTIPDPFRCRLCAERTSRVAEYYLDTAWLGMEFYARILNPAVIYGPRFSDRERLLFHC